MAGRKMSTTAGMRGRFRVFLTIMAVGFACGGPLLYFGGPPDLLLGERLSGGWVLITPAVVTVVAALLVGSRGIGRVVLSILAGTALMGSSSLLLGSRTYILGLLPVGLGLGGAALGHAAGSLIVAAVRALSRGSSFTGDQTTVWACTLLGVVGSFVLASAGFAGALAHGTVDYWLGAFYAVSFLGLGTGLASATAVAVLGARHA